MRSLVVAMLDERWNHADLPRKLTNGTESWVYALKGDFHGPTLPSLNTLASYNLIIANLNPPLIKHYAEVIHQKPAGLKWVSLVEGCGTDYYDPSPELLHVLNHSDLVVNINRLTTDYLQRLTTTKTEWIGIPYDFERISQFQTPLQDRRAEIFICPRAHKHPSVVVAEALGLTVKTYFRATSRKPRNLPLFIKHGYYKKDLAMQSWLKSPSQVQRVGALETNLTSLWRDAGGSKLWINLDPRFTWGRWVLDAAALRVPIITTESTGNGADLFPQTTVRDIFAVEEAIEIGKRLLADPEFAREVSDCAYERLCHYGPEATVARLYSAIHNAKDRNGAP